MQGTLMMMPRYDQPLVHLVWCWFLALPGMKTRRHGWVTARDLVFWSLSQRHLRPGSLVIRCTPGTACQVLSMVVYGVPGVGGIVQYICRIDGKAPQAS